MMFRFLSLAIVLVIFLTTPLRAQVEYPAYDNIYVNDYASVIDSSDEAYVRNVLEELRRETDIEFTVLTIQTMGNYGHNGPIESFATGLFNGWGVGDAIRNDGVLMLISRYDRKMRIEVGSGYGRSKDASMKRIIDDIIIPAFRSDAYSRGIRSGVDAVIYDLTHHYPGEYDSGLIEKPVNRAKRLGVWLLAPFAAIAGGVGLLFRRWRRNRPRICPVDGSPMRRLNETDDDAHLWEGQQTEEYLKSVDYDVWSCARCDHVTIESYRNWFSGYGACRVCNYRTTQGDTTIVSRATTSSSGLKRIDYNCHNCGATWAATKVIPRISKSSSGGSSFGGGSSSGGGASGSW